MVLRISIIFKTYFFVYDTVAYLSFIISFFFQVFSKVSYGFHLHLHLRSLSPARTYVFFGSTCAGVNFMQAFGQTDKWIGMRIIMIMLQAGGCGCGSGWGWGQHTHLSCIRNAFRQPAGPEVEMSEYLSHTIKEWQFRIVYCLFAFRGCWPTMG